MTGEPVPPASPESRNAIASSVGLLALMFLVGAPVMYALRAASDVGYAAEANLWIAQEGHVASERDAALDGSEGSRAAEPASATTNAWVGLLRSPVVLGSRALTEEESRAMSANLFVQMEPGGNVVELRLEWPDEDRAVELLEGVTERFASVARDLKLEKLEEAVAIADVALSAVEAELHAARDDGSPQRIEAAEALRAAIWEQRESARLAVASITPDVRILSPARLVDRR
jgi:hypothetical protein